MRTEEYQPVSRTLWFYWPESVRDEWAEWFRSRGFDLDVIRDFSVASDAVELSLIHKGKGMKPHSGVDCPDGTAARLMIPPHELCEFQTLLIDAEDHPQLGRPLP